MFQIVYAIVLTNVNDTLCSDTSHSCAMWAKNEECFGENFKSVMRQCPASCGICEPGCKDTDHMCRQWARDGECNDNMNFMMKTCPVSCGVCTVTCVDKVPIETCQAWKESGNICIRRGSSWKC